MDSHRSLNDKLSWLFLDDKTSDKDKTHVKSQNPYYYDTDSYDGLLMFTAFVAIKCAWLGEILGPTSFFGWREPVFLSQ